MRRIFQDGWRRRRNRRSTETAGAARIEPLEGRRLLSVALGGSSADDALEFAFRAPRSANAEATARPSVRSTNPDPGDVGVDPTTYVVAYVNLPNVGGIVDDPAVLAANVRLYRAGDPARNPIPSRVNTTGGGDAIILTPLHALAGNTEYAYEVTEGLTDTTGSPFQPFSMTFTTGPDDGIAPDPTIQFEQVSLPSAAGRRFTGITIGPDNNVYAGTMTGEIARFDILPDGTLGAAKIISSIRDNNAGAPRIVTGLRFDPASTAQNLKLWVSHGHGSETAAPDWTGKITQLTGDDLQFYQDYVVGLPRSTRDHLTQQMDFRPGTRELFVSQGSSSAMGDPDNAWGLRPERLLSGAILRIRVDMIATQIAAGGGPFNAQTDELPEGQTPFDPFAPSMPLRVYARGVRNAFDLVWHSNGSLYVPTNGSAPGGNTPAGPGVPALVNVNQNQPDLLFRVRQDKYYGHPNPSREEYVLNGGNPTDGVDPFEVPAYPVGTLPDPDWEAAVYNFGDNRSPNGVIEYKSNAFAGTLKGSLIVAEFSGGDDLVILRPDAAGKIATTNVRRGMVGTTGLVDPVDLVEDVGPGNLYVVEYGARRITLLRPIATQPTAPRNVGRAVFNDPVGSPASPARTVNIKNPNLGQITVSKIEIVGEDKGMFRITNAPTTPFVLAAGATVEVSLVFDPPSNAPLDIATAGLRLVPSDSSLPPLEMTLRGLPTSGANEPSLQHVFDLHELPLKSGDPTPLTADLPFPLGTPNDAQEIEGLVKAGSGPVRIEVMSVFAQAAASGSPAMRFGYYNPQNGAQTEVLTVNDAQRTRPGLASGDDSFDPGTGTFGLYTFATAAGTTSFTENERNTFEPVAANRQKALFYPLLDADGTVVPDSFIVAFEESAGSYDYQDFVAIIHNVRAADVPPPTTELTVLRDGTELNSGATVAFGTVQQGTAAPERTITIRNDGNLPLIIGAVTLPAGFELVQGFSTTALAPGASDTLRVAMSTATAQAFDAQATLASSDSDEGTFVLRFTGSVQEEVVTPPPPGGGDDDPPPPPPPGSDLPVLTADVTGGLPPVVVAGTKSARGRVTVMVRNNNALGFSGPVTISVEAAGATSAAREASVTAATQAGGGTVLVQTTKVLKLKPNAQKPVKLKVAVPSDLPEGDKALRVSVMTSDGKSDTVTGQAFRVEAPVVRLVGSPTSAPGVVLTFGKTARLGLGLLNEGTVPTTRTPATFQLLVSTSPSNADAPVYETFVSGRLAIKPGVTRLQPVKLMILPGAIPAGDYYLHVRIGAELNLTNGQTQVVVPFSIS